LPTLQRFEVDKNALTGPVPRFGTREEGAANKKLRIINLSSNNFLGELPMEWIQLTALEAVGLEDNEGLVLSNSKQVFSARVELKT
jgi:hypothetical protein